MSQLDEKREAVELDAMKPDEGGMADGRHNIPAIVVMCPIEDMEQNADANKGGADHAVRSGQKHDDNNNNNNKTGMATRAHYKQPSVMTRLLTDNFNAKMKVVIVTLFFLGVFLLMAAFAVGLGAYATQLEELRAEVHGMPHVSTVTAVPATGLTERHLEVSTNGHQTPVSQRMAYPHLLRGVDMSGATARDFAKDTFTTTIPVMTLFVNATTTTSMTTTMTATTTSMVGPVNTSGPVVVVPMTGLTIAVPLGTAQGSMATTSTATGTALSPSSPSLTESCGEWGDGAGPCARPYGAPNATPASVLESMLATPASSLANLGAGASQMALTTTLLPSVPVTSTSPVAFTTSFSDASVLDAPTATPVAPTVTVTVTSFVNNATCGLLPGITETVATVAQPSSSSPTIPTTTTPRTIYVTSTYINLVTFTLRASDGGPFLTVTETAYWSNSSSTTTTTAFQNASAPASTANFTLTLKSIVTPGAGFGGPDGGYGNGNGSLRGSVAPTVFTPATSGAQKKATPPKGMGANGSSGGGTGAGVYCVVMLVALVAMLG